jgi:hypothetical protein
MRNLFTTLGIWTVALEAVPSAYAGMIYSVTNLTSGCATLTTRQDNSIASKRFGDGICDSDVQFMVSNTANTTFLAFSETVSNNTSQAWADFHIRLGFGSGQNFIPSNSQDGLTFPNSPASTSNGFNNLTRDSDNLNWDQGSVLANNVSFTFTIAIPNFNTNMPEQAITPCPAGQPAPCYTFTLRETPSVPEPRSALLVGIGAIGMLLFRGLRLRSQRRTCLPQVDKGNGPASLAGLGTNYKHLAS